ncbi:MAG: MBL fold metallo-hydrolase [Deltaproteobacteria bacterium]|nr:MBL fold metallo-hydrolase [Deltaproteobacteria bacterium]
MGAIIQQCAVGPMANFSYVLGDPATRCGAVIDPGWEAETLVAAVQAAGLKLHAVLLTHNHFDHIGALEELCMLAKPSVVYVHAADAAGLPALTTPVQTTRDGEVLTLGALRVECLHTPGHTPGGQCFLVGGDCFTGDTLFVDGCGRVDLPGSDPEQMYHSLRRLAALERETVIYAGHDYGSAPTSTIGAQQTTNPYLRAANREEFFRFRLG